MLLRGEHPIFATTYSPKMVLKLPLAGMDDISDSLIGQVPRMGINWNVKI